MNCVRTNNSEELVPGNLFLSRKFLVNEFSRNAQDSA
jgi:hypothetical protein